jgi:hypothetical protein
MCIVHSASRFVDCVFTFISFFAQATTLRLVAFERGVSLNAGTEISASYDDNSLFGIHSKECGPVNFMELQGGEFLIS